MALFNKNKKLTNDRLFILDKTKKGIEFKGLTDCKDEPLISLFRDFSAPVKWNYDISIEASLELLKYDDNNFSRWASSQNISKYIILKRSENNSAGGP